MVKFSRESLDPHLSAGAQDPTVEGSLVTREEIRGSVEMRVIEPPNRDLKVSVAPNPLNPVGVLTLRTGKHGPVTVRMFDLRGRLVRTLVEARTLPAGIHEVKIDGRGDQGQELTSGVYFYRAETVEGIAKGRVAILK